MALPSTIDIQRLEHLWNHENMFETGVVLATEFNHIARSADIIWIFFLIFYNMKVYCVLALESPH